MRRLVESAYQRALDIIREHRDQIDTLASQLYEREVLFREDLVNIFGERPWEAQQSKDLERGSKAENGDETEGTENEESQAENPQAEQTDNDEVADNATSSGNDNDKQEQ